MSKKTNRTPFIVKIAMSAIGLACLTSNLNAGVIPGLGLGQSTGLTGALKGIGGNELNSAISNLDGQLPGNQLNFPLLLDSTTDNITLPGLAPNGRDTNTPSSGNSSGKKAKHKSPIEPISAPLGHSLNRLIDTIDASLDPITNPVDDTITTPIITITSPLSDPLLLIVDPITAPIDGIVSDLTGGSLEDAPTNKDYNRRDGNGAINDLLGNEHQAHGESGEASLIPIVSKPLGKVADRFISAADEGLDPLTDVIDEQIFEPTLNILAPITEPLLSILEPATDPIDGTLADLTGGSVEDALTNNDDNTEDGNGVVNDLLGGDKNRNKPNDNGTFGNNGNDKPVGNAQGKPPKNKSPIQPISAPLGRSLTPLIDAVDETLDPVTDPVDQLIAEPILSAIAPASDPLLEALSPATNPIDGIVSDLTGGSIEDALTNQDYNNQDGNGPVNDSLGHGRTKHSGKEKGEASPAPWLTKPVGLAAKDLINAIDLGLDPITDVIDDQILEPILDAVAPITEPALTVIEPATDTIDGTLDDLTGGSAEDALTNNDDNTEDGNGVVNDLFGGDTSPDTPSDSGNDGSLLGAVFAPIGEVIDPLISAIDQALDPVTDPVDDQVLAPVLDATAPVIEPILETAEPVLTPTDAIVADLTGGSLSDALSNNDSNTTDGNGLVNDLIGGDAATDAPNDSGDDASPLDPATTPIGEALDPLVTVIDETLDPVTDPVNDQVLAPPVVTPVDVVVGDLTGGSIDDALSNNDSNTADGNGLVNDLIGGDAATDASDDSGDGSTDVQGSDPSTGGSSSTTNDQDLNDNPRFYSDDSMLEANNTNNASSSKNQSAEAKPADNCSLNGKEPIIFQFNTDDASLTDRFISLAKESAELIASCETQQFKVSGHTDNVHTDEYNQKLSESRANEVANYLVKLGISRSQIIVRGYGESQPLATNDTKSGRAKNRRVELNI
jgi:outer membrane protein OmpA-like peptidoglycan-associated protein